jgi:hypothetical protein
MSDLLAVSSMGSDLIMGAAEPQMSLGLPANLSDSGSGGGITITIEEGAVVVQVGDGVDPEEAREAFDDASDALVDKLLAATRRQ